MYFIQSCEKENPLTIIKAFIDIVDQPILFDLVDERLKSIASISVNDVILTLEQFGVLVSPVKIEIEMILKNKFFPSILLTRNSQSPCIIINGKIGSAVEIIHPRFGKILLELEEIESEYEGFAIVLKEIKEINKEDYLKRVIQKQIELKSRINSLITLSPKFVSDKDCDLLIKASEHLMQKSLIRKGSNSQAKSFARTSFNCRLNRDIDISQKIFNIVSNKLNIDSVFFEEISIIRYDKGQEYKAHFDTPDEKKEEGLRDIKYNGRRTKTIIIYLSDAFLGGGTFFPALNHLVEPVKGMALMFNNVKADGCLNRDSLHSGLPVYNGVKYIASIWIRDIKCIS